MRSVVSLWLLAAVVLVSGCASLTARPPEEVVAERAMLQVEALMAGDFETALTYMTPSYQGSPKADSYARNRAAAPGWSDAYLKWVKCENVPDPARCDVRIIIKMARPPVVATLITVPIDDVWIKVDGEWYQYE